MKTYLHCVMNVLFTFSLVFLALFGISTVHTLLREHPVLLSAMTYVMVCGAYLLGRLTGQAQVLAEAYRAYIIVPGEPKE